MAESRTWITHFGKKCPVSKKSIVWIKLRNGHEPADPIVAEKWVWIWKYGDFEFEITHYALT